MQVKPCTILVSYDPITGQLYFALSDLGCAQHLFGLTHLTGRGIGGTTFFYSPERLHSG